ncbi:MAG: nitrous oxide-stimulated promoter family protein [Coriobacteriaceae bacterium]|nr:nitrous oxide-stimulated promoter family protein [Coriobacteriaceae bacterium]
MHCYAPAQRQAIKDVMRYAGPRMLLSHPAMTVRHGIDTLRARQSHQ